MPNRQRSLHKFMKENRRFFADRLVKTFIEKEDNKALLKTAIEQGDRIASDTLDKRFEVFYMKVRMIQYTHKLARFYTKTYDQKKRKQQAELTFDRSIDGDCHGSPSMEELIPASESSLEDEISHSIPELLPTKQMGKAFKSFGEQKKAVVHLYTFAQYTNKEIAETLNCTPQNVSKMKFKAFSQLKGENVHG